MFYGSFPPETYKKWHFENAFVNSDETRINLILVLFKIVSEIIDGSVWIFFIAMCSICLFVYFNVYFES